MSKIFTTQMLRTPEGLAEWQRVKESEAKAMRAKRPAPATPPAKATPAASAQLAAALEAKSAVPEYTQNSLRKMRLAMNHDTEYFRAAVAAVSKAVRDFDRVSRELDGHSRGDAGMRYATHAHEGGETTRRAFDEHHQGKRLALKRQLAKISRECAAVCRPAIHEFRAAALIFIDALEADERKRCSAFEVRFSTPSLVVNLRASLRILDKAVRDESLYAQGITVNPASMLPF